MNTRPTALLTQVLLIGLTVFLVPGGASAHCDGKHTGDHPHCSDGGGDGGGDIAMNDITVRWDMVDATGTGVEGTGVTPRRCMIDDNPQPNGTHTPYFCVQDPTHTVFVNLTGGTVEGKKGANDPANQEECATGYMFEAYPSNQYVVAAGGEVCTGENGCSLAVNNVFANQATTPYNHVKLQAAGQVPQSSTLNPFACPEDGSAPVTQFVPMQTVDVMIRRNSGGSADLVCRFDVTGTTFMEITPVCP